MIMADTSVWIEFFRGNPIPPVMRLKAAKSSEELLLGDLILMEVQQGITNRKDFKLVRFVFDQLECRSLGGWDIAMESADHYQYLRKKGHIVRKAIDMIIGTYCIRHGIWLIHNDRDFELMEKHLGLKAMN